MTLRLNANLAKRAKKIWAHHYHFVVYALDADLGLEPGLTRADLLAASQGHVIGQGELVALYERKAP